MNISRAIRGPGIDIHSRDSSGRTLLHLAVQQRPCNEDAIRQLLNMGASVNAYDDDHESPLHCAVQNQDCPPNVIKLLLDKSTDMHSVNDSSRTLVSTSQFTASININEQSIDGKYPLHFAVIYNTQAIKVLLDGGALVNVLDHSNHSPLFNAVHSIKREVIKVLLDAGALISCGESPLLLAIRMYSRGHEDSFESVKLLLKYALLIGPLCDFLVDSQICEKWLDYERKYQGEIHRMHSDEVDHETTLIQFIFRLRLKSPCDVEKDIRCHINKILQILATNTYPYYNEVIFGLLKRDYLMDKHKEQTLYTVRRNFNEYSVKDITMLNYHSLCSIAIYLTDDELLYLVLALSNIHNCVLSVNSFKSKPSHHMHWAIEGSSARTRIVQKLKRHRRQKYVVQ